MENRRMSNQLNLVKNILKFSEESRKDELEKKNIERINNMFIFKK